MFYGVEAGLSRDKSERPHMRAWRERVTSRPAYQRAEAKGGPAVRAG